MSDGLINMSPDVEHAKEVHDRAIKLLEQLVDEGISNGDKAAIILTAYSVLVANGCNSEDEVLDMVASDMCNTESSALCMYIDRKVLGR